MVKQVYHMPPNTKIISFGPQPEQVKYCDPISDTVQLNGWTVSRGIDEHGAIILSTHKSFGSFKNDDSDKAEMQIKLSTTSYKVPPIKAAIGNEYGYFKEVLYAEIPDGKNRLSASLPKDRFVDRKYKESSILTPTEYFDELIPEFKQIMAIKELNEITAKIKDDVAQVHQNSDRYKVSK